jgi:hypothetical protein
MFRKALATVVMEMILVSVSGFPSVLAQTEKNQAAEKALATVQKLGLGRDARVEVRLRDNTKLKGYISASDDDSFTVTNLKTGATQDVAYSETLDVKKSGGGLSKLTWGIIGGAAAAAVIVGLTVIKPVVCDGGAGC